MVYMGSDQCTWSRICGGTCSSQNCRIRARSVSGTAMPSVSRPGEVEPTAGVAPEEITREVVEDLTAALAEFEAVAAATYVQGIGNYVAAARAGKLRAVLVLAVA